MKLDKETLKKIIKEELEDVLDESMLLKKYVKDKDDELKQYMQDMGKDPDEIKAAVGPDSYNMMGQSLVPGFPKRMPLTRNVRIRLARKEIYTVYSGMEGFYNPDSTGSSPFSTIIKLLPELGDHPRVKRAIKLAGGDPTKVTAKIGKRATYLTLKNLIDNLHRGLDKTLDKFKE